MTAPVASRAALPLAGDCCAPLLREPLTQAQATDLARVLKALADPTRLRMLDLLAQQDQPLCVSDITDQFTHNQPTVSHHLTLLRPTPVDA